MLAEHVARVIGMREPLKRLNRDELPGLNADVNANRAGLVPAQRALRACRAYAIKVAEMEAAAEPDLVR